MSEKDQSRKSMFIAKNMEELRRLYHTDTPVLAYAFKRQTDEGWTPEHSHQRGQLVALTQGLIIVEAGSERWRHPSHRCVWIPPNCLHAARSVGGAAGAVVDLSPEMVDPNGFCRVCKGLPRRLVRGRGRPHSSCYRHKKKNEKQHKCKPMHTGLLP